MLHALRRAAGSPRVGLPALAGGLAFLGLWTKLVFAWTLPAAVLFAAMESRRTREPLARRLLQLGVFVLAWAVPTAILLVSKDEDGVPYYDIVRKGHISLEQTTQDLGLPPALLIGRFFANGAEILPRTLHLEGSPLDAAPLLLAAVLLTSAARAGPAPHAWLMLAAVTFASTVLTRSAWGPHHVAFTLFFVTVGLGLALAGLGARARLAAAAVVAVYWAFLSLRLPSATIQVDTSFGKDALLRGLSATGLDRRSVQVHTSWGTFYIAHLFAAADGVVLWAPGLSDRPEALSEVRRIAIETQRAIVEISLRPVQRIATRATLAAFGAPRRIEHYGEWQLVEFAEPARR
jgi:hypothetical protein